MRFGRRPGSGPARDPSPGQPAAFWAWWASDGRESTTTMLQAEAPGPSHGAVGRLDEAVSAMHSGLAWEVGPGEVAAYRMVVTAAGDPGLRAIARRWLLAAPTDDPVWSFTDFRPPASDLDSAVLRLDDGPEVDLARVAVTARAAGSRFDVAVHHPAFAEVPEEVRAQLAFLALDRALGERDVELWLGHITASELGLIDGFGLAGLRAVVGDLRSRHLDADGQPAWAMLSGEGPDGVVQALAQVPLHPLTAPDLTLHVVVLLPYLGADDAGLPDASLEALRSFEASLTEALGATGRVVAHESSAGVRVLHLYLDETTDALSVVRRHAAGWTEGTARVESAVDPAWDGVRHLRT